MTSPARIKARLGTEGVLERWRRKVHDLRLVVAGDYSPIDGEASPQMPMGDARERSREAAGLMDVLVTDLEEGTSNKMLQALRTLVQQSAFRMPEIEFEDVDALEAAVNSLYLKKRLGPKPLGCDAVPHMRRALWHYVIDGIGWVWCGVLGGKPTVVCVDTLDVVWDTSVAEPTDSRWVAVRWADALGYWVDQYGEGPFGDLLGGSPEDRERALERTVELLFYYDVDGPKGTHAAYRCDEAGRARGEAIETTDNPHTMDSDGLPAPFLPLEPLYYLGLPSVKAPVGIAELILPAQMALRNDQRHMNAAVKAGMPWLEADEGSYDEDEWDKLSKGEFAEMIKRKSGKSGAEAKGGLEIPKTVLLHSQAAESELYASSGANPYASGSKVEGVTYAAEVNAIEGNASLVAGWIATDNAACWGRVAKKCLANGKAYDLMPLRLTLDGEALEFGPEDPIGDYLRADADPVVAEDSAAFAPRDKRIGDAAALMSAAKTVEATHPGLLTVAVEKFARAWGLRDVAKVMAPPAPPPGMVPGMGDPVAEGVSEAGVAAASTQ